jgi:hypothetical protein
MSAHLVHSETCSTYHLASALQLGGQTFNKGVLLYHLASSLCGAQQWKYWWHGDVLTTATTKQGWAMMGSAMHSSTITMCTQQAIHHRCFRISKSWRDSEATPDRCIFPARSLWPTFLAQLSVVYNYRHAQLSMLPLYHYFQKIGLFWTDCVIEAEGNWFIT